MVLIQLGCSSPMELGHSGHMELECFGTMMLGYSGPTILGCFSSSVLGSGDLGCSLASWIWDAPSPCWDRRGEVKSVEGMVWP